MSIEFIKLIVDIILLALAPVAGYVMKTYLKGINDRFDHLIISIEAMREEMHKMQLQNSDHHGKIKGLDDRVTNHDTRLNSHSERLRKVEIDLAKGTKP